MGTNTGVDNSGDWNSGDGNSGWFNTDEPKARFFNKETNLLLSDFLESDRCPTLGDFSLNRWINKKDMTDKEKKEIVGWETMDGYLKTLSYKEAWKIYWEETDEENRQKFLNLPNFDPSIFQEITGVNVGKNETVKIGNREYDKWEVEEALKDVKSIN